MAPPIAARNNSLRFMIDEDCLIMIKFAPRGATGCPG
jgi:hypothetical protein